MKTIDSSSYLVTKGLCAPEMKLSQYHYNQTYQQVIVSRRGKGEEEEAVSGCFAKGLPFLVSGVVRNISVVTADSTVSSQELENKPFAGTQRQCCSD